MSSRASVFGPLPDGWSAACLGDIAERIRNGTTATQNEEARGLPVTRIETISDGVIDRRRVRHIDADPATLEQYLVQPGDLLLSHINSIAHIGKVARFSGGPPLVHGMNLLLIRVMADSADGGFAFHALASQATRDYFKRHAKKAINQASLSIKDIADLILPLPPRSEQRKIAAILSSVDETIEKTEAVIAQIDVVKKATLEDLMSADTAHDVSLVDVCHRITDGEHKTPTRTPTGVLLLSARNVRDGELSLADVDYVPPEEFQRMKWRCHPEAGDVLLSCSGSIGRAARVPSGLTFGLVRSVALIKPDPSRLVTAYLEQVLRSARLQRQMDETKKQAAQANLFIGAIEKLRIPLPEIAEQNRIAGVLDAVDQRIREEQLVCQALRGTKAAIATTLLSGDLRVVGVGVP